MTACIYIYIRRNPCVSRFPGEIIFRFVCFLWHIWIQGRSHVGTRMIIILLLFPPALRTPWNDHGSIWWWHLDVYILSFNVSSRDTCSSSPVATGCDVQPKELPNKACSYRTRPAVACFDMTMITCPFCAGSVRTVYRLVRVQVCFYFRVHGWFHNAYD